MVKEYTDEDILRRLHVDQEKSFKEIADYFDINIKTARRHIKEKVGVHPPAMDSPLIYVEDNTIHSLYWNDELTQSEIGDRYGITKEAVQSYMDRNNIDVDRNRSPDTLTEEHKEKISNSLSGIEKDDEWRKNLSSSMSGHTKDKLWRENLSKSHRGSGDTSEDDYLYNSPYQVRRASVVNRDDGSCVECGSNEDLSVHHIVPVRLFAKWDVPNISDAHVESNMVTLCHDCHMEKH